MLENTIKRWGLWAAVAGGAALGGCARLQKFPQQLPGWHSRHYHTLLGRLERSRIAPGVTIIYYDLPVSTDPYGGRFALTPKAKLYGFAIGQLVQIRGHISKKPDKKGAGTLYHIDSVRLWHRQTAW